MTIEEIKKEIYDNISANNKPEGWRQGQYVFNLVNKLYNHVGRVAQFTHGVDCFYRDDKIDEFIETCAKIIYNSQNEQSH